MTSDVDIEDIERAAERLAPFITQTPLLRSPVLDVRARGQVFLKAENLQQTGSFKIRGALNTLLKLSPVERHRGVVAYSSGNHAQGVAMAARLLDMSATIVMPEDAPAVKRDRTRRMGAEVVTYDRNGESREEIAGRLAEEKGATLIPPFDHPDIIAGQGTVGLEIAEDARRLGLTLDQVLVCCSGGGLSSGVGIALKARSPKTRLVTVEPNGFDDVRRSLIAGTRVTNPPGGSSVCDALLLQTPGLLTFSILKRLGAVGLSVSDREAMGAIRFAADELKVIVEPGGAVALAAMLFGEAATQGMVSVGVLSGGNIDPATFDRAMRYAI